MFDRNFFLLLVALTLLVTLSYLRGGGELVVRGLGSGAALLLRYAPILLLSFLAAGLAESLVPPTWIRRSLGAESGLRGILIASGAGLLTPAGPFVSMPIAAAMLGAGAGVGSVVAFVTAWSLLAIHRFVAWEVPVLGWPLATLRYGLCLGVPVLAGLAARALSRS